MAVLPRTISTGNVPADGSLQDGGRSAVVLFELEQNHSWLWVVFQIVLQTVRPLRADGLPLSRLSSNRTVLGSGWWSKINRGPSGPWGQMVRLLLNFLGQKPYRFWWFARSKGRTVRPSTFSLPRDAVSLSVRSV